MFEELGIDVVVERLGWIIENFCEYECKPYHEVGMYDIISDSSHADEINLESFYGV